MTLLAKTNINWLGDQYDISNIPNTGYNYRQDDMWQWTSHMVDDYGQVG